MYCFKRGAFWYFRTRVPSDLIGVVGKAEVLRSLKTQDGRTARGLAGNYRNLYQRTFHQLRFAQVAGMGPPELLGLFKSATELGQALPAASKSYRLSGLISDYVDDRQHSWAPKTLKINQSVFELLLLVIGDRPLAEITRPTMREFRNTLLVMPVNAQRSANCRTLNEMLKLDRPTLDPKTVNRNISFVSTMMNWALKEGHIDANPVSGLTLPIERDPSTERKVFDPESLGVLLSNLETGDLAVVRKWMPLIALYSGMRIEEIAQLRPSDITEVEGHWCFTITSEAGSVKTASANRVVPIHPELVGRGLLHHCQSVQLSGQERLWCELRQDKYGKWSSSYSKWFGRYRKRIGIVDPKITFHSLRHTFINQLKQADVSEPIIAALVGHKNNSLTLNRYGKAYGVGVLSEAVQKAVFITNS
jgi:integrase